jgi:hypoxanthine phosphoribosyltransferase
MDEVNLEVLISAEEIAVRVSEVAEEIARDLNGEPVILIGVLKGSIHFISDLSRALPGPAMIDFMQLASYAGTSSTGVVQFKRDHDLSIEGRHVVVVEDIVDSGLTLEYLLKVLAERRPASLRTAALLVKPDAVTRRVPLDYVGFAISNEFVVGYGLDWDERFRTLPYVAVLKPTA